MIEKEAQDLIDASIVKSFNIWWRDEAVEHITYHSEESEKLVYDLCYIAWMNGALKRGEM